MSSIIVVQLSIHVLVLVLVLVYGSGTFFISIRVIFKPTSGDVEI
jgi:hypothetical protein